MFEPKRRVPAGAPFLSQAAGRVWFEVAKPNPQVQARGSKLWVGFAGTNFRGTAEVGKDAASWVVGTDGSTSNG
jgi:hypothetical protein